LIQRNPFVRIAPRFGDLILGKPLGPQALAHRAPDRVVLFRDHRQPDMFPCEAERRVALHHAAEQVELVETRHNDHPARIWLQARHKVAGVPFPGLWGLGVTRPGTGPFNARPCGVFELPTLSPQGSRNALLD
jgi:hypothetical protein